MRVLTEETIRELVGPTEALAAVREAFVSYARGEATLPSPSDLDLPGRAGEMHVKGAFIHGEPYFSYKAASGFYANAEKGLPITGGLNLVFSAETGFLEAILLDNGYLTDIRTGAAGAIASDLLAVEGSVSVGVVGAGNQARHQLQALAVLRPVTEISVFSRTPSNTQAFVEAVGASLGVEVHSVQSGREAVEGRDIVITSTPARSPVVLTHWISPGTHVTAIGADLPDKQEIDPSLFSRATCVAADDVEHASNSGDLHHALIAEAIRKEEVVAIGDLIVGSAPGRQTDRDITIADLTGLGIQDAAVANVALSAAKAVGAGSELHS